MRVLFVCHRVPYPPKRGGKIRPFNIIRHLHEQGHEVTVASLARSSTEQEEAGGLQSYCTERIVEVVDDRRAWPRMVAWLPTTRPSSFGYFHSPRLRERINEYWRAGVPDLIFVHCSSVAPYVADLKAGLKILDFGDMEGILAAPVVSAFGGLLAGGSQARAHRKAAGGQVRPRDVHDACGDGVAAGVGGDNPIGLVSERRRRRVFQTRRRGLRAGLGNLRRPHGLLPEPAGGDPVLRRGAA
jgi:hypothetical protein